MPDKIVFHGRASKKYEGGTYHVEAEVSGGGSKISIHVIEGLDDKWLNYNGHTASPLILVTLASSVSKAPSGNSKMAKAYYPKSRAFPSERYLGEKMAADIRLYGYRNFAPPEVTHPTDFIFSRAIDDFMKAAVPRFDFSGIPQEHREYCLVAFRTFKQKMRKRPLARKKGKIEVVDLGPNASRRSEEEHIRSLTGTTRDDVIRERFARIDLWKRKPIIQISPLRKKWSAPK